MRWLVVAAFLAAMLSGCLADDFDTQDAGDEPVAPGGPSGQPGSGSASTHGDPDVEEGAVTTEAPGATGSPYWSASQTITIDNDFGGAARSDVGITFGPGDIQVVPSSDGDYHYTLTLIGRGGTEEEARQALEDLDWDHSDDLRGGTLVLDTWVEGPAVSGISCTGVPPVTSCTGRSWSVDLIAELPSAPAHDIDLDHGSADVVASDLGGSALAIDVGSGDVTLEGLTFADLVVGTGSGDIDAQDVSASAIDADSGSGDHTWVGVAAGTVHLGAGSGDLVYDGRADRLVADTGSGDHSYDLRGAHVEAIASSGSITLDFTPIASGELGLETGSGAVDVTLADSAYDITASVGSGDIDIDVDGTERVDDGDDEDFAHYRTPGFASASPATAIGVDTGSGDVTVQG